MFIKYFNRTTITFLLFNFLALSAAYVRADVGELPAGIKKQIPLGYGVLSTAKGLLDGDTLEDFLVVINRQNEFALSRSSAAPARPLLLFTQNADASYTLARRNDHVVLRVNEGGQCDPFEDGTDGLVIKNRYFTIQNAVACGQHWELFITFKYDRVLKDWVFHKRSTESWKLGDGDDGLESEGLVVVAGKDKAKILFKDFRNP